MTLASAVILRSESRGTHDHILLSHIPDYPNLESQVPVFTCCVAQLYSQALQNVLVITSRHGHIENIVSILIV
jgi:hypothetical protein